MNAKELARLALLCVAGVALFAAAPAFAELVLVENGVSRAPIVVFQDAPKYTRLAADHLAEYIEKTSGAKPRIIEGRPDPLPANAIWVGYQPVLGELLPSLDFDFQHPEEILVSAGENHLVIAGRDRWTPGSDRQQEYGTANAVYTFLQDYLGVRWLWPGEFGTDIAERKTIAFSPFEYRYHPQIRGRSGIFTMSSLGGRVAISYDWVQFQRLRLDSLSFPGGHAFHTWWGRFHETHPEFFALQPDGSRGGGETPYPSARTVKMCKSNPALWEQWLADVEAQLEANPNQTVFNASPNDGWGSGWCICENCRAWDHPDGELRTFRWQGLAQPYVALSDRQVTFANKVAGLLRERYPDRDYYVLMMAYGHSRPAPIEARPADNVIISSVANFILRPENADRGSPAGTLHRDQFAGWGRVTKNIAWRPNTGSPAGWRAGLPDVPITVTARDLKFVAEHGCVGIFIDTVWENWATQGPLYYMMAQLAWNPERDAKEIMADYCRRGFGEAAEDIEAYWGFLEETREKYVATGPPYSATYDAAFFEKAGAMLDRAAQAVSDGPETHRQRIGYVRAGLEYTRLMVDSADAVAQWRESGEQDTDAAARARANWDGIGQLSAEYPNLLNWRRLEPRHGRTAGFHPDGESADIRLPLAE